MPATAYEWMGLAAVPVAMVNRAGAAQRLLAGGIAPKPESWRRSQWLALQEPRVNAVVTQMRTTLGWTVAQRNTFMAQLKNRATAEAGV